MGAGLPATFAGLQPLLPEDQVGTVTAIQPISLGLSGAGIFAVSGTRGDFVLRVQPEREAGGQRWTQHLRILRRAAAAGVAPAIVHVDEAARAILSQRVPGVLLPALFSDPQRRSAALEDVVDRLRALHGLDPTDIDARDPIELARKQNATQRIRPGFPTWAAELAAIVDAIAVTLARDPRRVVSHNDLNPGNILWDGQRAWLVDWEVAGLAHPYYDLAALAMFLRFDDGAAHRLLERLEQRPIALRERDSDTFTALRRLAALLGGLTLLGKVPDLGILPAQAPRLEEVYAGMRAGTLALQEPRGLAAFALALLKTGTTPSA